MSSVSALNAMPRMPTVIVGQVVRCSSRATRYSGRPSFTIMLAWPSVKLLLLNAASCIVSLNRHGPAAKPAPGMSAARG